ncbi:MAG: hypothetical protein M1115_05640 [Actinobacteria bacterium]|nr:hypothetical protein [Actinomycetota bacterium]
MELVTFCSTGRADGAVGCGRGDLSPDRNVIVADRSQTWGMMEPMTAKHSKADATLLNGEGHMGGAGEGPEGGEIAPQVRAGAADGNGRERQASHFPEELEAGMKLLESCNSTWVFDVERMRFRRVLKGLDLDVQWATTAWRPYFGLEIDPLSESFVVLLNAEGTRLLRSWRHVEHCRQCDGQATTELSLDELRAAVLG